MKNEISKEILKSEITKYKTFKNENLDENVLNYIFEELKNDSLPYVSELGNEILKDYIGLNDEQKPMLISELQEKHSGDCIVHIMLDNVLCSICFRIRYANQLSKSDSSIDVVSLYKAIEKLSTKTLNLLYRYQILNVSELLNINENNRGRIKMLGNNGLMEVQVAQEIISKTQKNKEETSADIQTEDELSSIKEELKDTQSKALSMLFGYKKIVELMQQKQELQEQLNVIDQEIAQIISSKMEPTGGFGNGTK